MKLHGIQISRKIDFEKYLVVINQFRQKSKHFRYKMICTRLQNQVEKNIFVIEKWTVSKLGIKIDDCARYGGPRGGLTFT